MPRTAKLSKAELSGRLSTVFQQYGYEGASLKMLAQATGLSKASLYHHFPKGKEDMAAHVLGQAGVRLQRLVLAPLATKGLAVQRLHESLEGTRQYYAGEVPVCLMNSLLLGEGLALFGGQIKSAVEIWQRGLAKAIQEVGGSADEAKTWSAYAVERIQGALILCRVRHERTPLEACLDELMGDVDGFSSQ